MGKTHVVVGCCILAIVVALVSLFRGSGSNEEVVVEEADWVCLECGHIYVFTQKEMEAHYRDNYGEPLSCPECDGLEVQPAEHCPHCEEAYGRPASVNHCPHCNQAL